MNRRLFSRISIRWRMTSSSTSPVGMGRPWTRRCHRIASNTVAACGCAQISSCVSSIFGVESECPCSEIAAGMGTSRELCGCRRNARGLGRQFRSPLRPPPPGPRPRLLAQPGFLSTGSSFEIPRCIPLRIDPNERRCASALLTTKSYVADEGVPADVSAAEE
jgi:hypothetical protein